MGVNAVAPSHHRDALSRLQALAHHGELFLGAPSATPLLAEDFNGFIFAGSHKHSRLPIPYGEGETVSCLSGGLFTADQLKSKLKERMEAPRRPAAKVKGGIDFYKIKLRAVGYRLVYQVLENKVVILVLSAGKHERNAAYKAVLDRLGDG